VSASFFSPTQTLRASLPEFRMRAGGKFGQKELPQRKGQESIEKIVSTYFYLLMILNLHSCFTIKKKRKQKEQDKNCERLFGALPNSRKSKA